MDSRIDSRRTQLTATLAAVVAVLAVIALLVTTYRGDSEPTAETSAPPVTGEPAPAGQTATPTSSPTSSDARQGDDASDTYTPNPRTRAEIARVTVEFLKAWKRPGTPAQRTERIGPYATTHLTSQLADVAAANLPTGKIVGEPELRVANQFAAATITELGDGLRVRCNLALDANGWRVTQVLPVEEATDGATDQPSDQPTDQPTEGSTPERGGR